MKKVLLTLAICISICAGISSQAGPGKHIAAKPSTCTCNTSVFNACFNETIYYTFEYDCVSRILIGIQAKDGSGNPFVVQGLVVNSDKTFEINVIDEPNCNEVYVYGSYDFTVGCGITITSTRCFPGGACLLKFR